MCPSPARRATPLPPDERRDAIVGAALPLLVERGPTVTTRELAEAAGVAEGTLFKVFGDKERIVAAVVEAAVDPEPLERAIEAVEIDGDGRHLVEVVGILQRRTATLFRLMAALGSAGHRKRPSMPVSPALVRYVERSGLDLRLPADEAADVLRSVIFSRSHPLLCDPPADPSSIAELFLHGTVRRGDAT